MRILLACCLSFQLATFNVVAQEGIVRLSGHQSAPQQPAPSVSPLPPVPQLTAPRQEASQQPAPQQEIPEFPAPQQEVPQQGTPQQGTPQQGTPQQAAPQADPFTDDPAPSTLDDLNVNSNQALNYDDSANSMFNNSGNFQSSIASNSNFRGASPQMVGDFGGGSMLKTIGGVYNGANFDGANLLTVPIALAGGSRRVKIAENNQVMPEDRVYGTFNYFHNSNQAIGGGPSLFDPVTVVDSESLAQYTVGFEKSFCVWESPFSIDVRMPFTGGVSQFVVNEGLDPATRSSLDLQTSSMGNLSTTLKAYLLEVKQTSISGGLGISLPTGSPVHMETNFYVPDLVGDPVPSVNLINVDNNAVHLMPFLGAYRQMGKSCWVQAFTQIDIATNGNDVQLLQAVADNGVDFVVTGYDEFSLKEQNLLYADVSFGKWWYRNVCECGRPDCSCRQRGVTGVASVLELHYTGSLNDADNALSQGLENRFDVLNLTTGLQVELNEQWRINLAGVFPLRERTFGAGGRQDDRFFDSEFALQINRFY